MIGADNQISLLQADLPELFCCSTLSDGLAAAVIALHQGLRNRKGAPLSLDQIYVVRKLIEKVRSDPFLHFDTSLELIDGLVAAGLKTDPQEAEEVSEFLAV